MRKLALIVIVPCALVLSGCPSPSSAVRTEEPVQGPQLPPVPANLQPREPTFTQRLQQILSSSPVKPTTQPATSTPASK